MFNAHNIEKHYGARTVLDGVSLSIGSRHRVGLIGRNGCGKTTLLRILAGVDTADRGSVSGVRHGVSIGYLAQIPAFAQGESLMNAIGRVIPPDVAEWEIRKALMGLGFTAAQFTQDARTLSGGEKTRLMLAGVLLGRHDLLILDEPTSHLDLAMLRWLEGYLSSYAGAVLVSSHDRRFLDNVVDSILELDGGKLSRFVGGYTQYAEAKRQMLEQQRADYVLQQRQIRALEEFVRRQLGWAEKTQSGPKRGRDQRGRISEKMAKRAHAAEKRIEQMEKVDKPRDSFHLNAALAPDRRSGRRVFEARGLGKAYGNRTLWQDLDLDIEYGERIGIVGPNGSGKTTLLRVLLGEEDQTAGSVIAGAGLVPLRMEQEHQNLDPELTVLQTVEAVGGMTQTEARTLLACFLFREDEVFKRVGDLSGGERARLAVTGAVISGANLLVLDEPTNHLDIDTRERLEQALEAYTGTMLIVSHDRWLLERLTNRTLIFGNGQVTDVPEAYSKRSEQ
jgi:ATPase subunit of ABC transporter with duplicated ATPase domains